jgi:uncharacterized protein
MNNKYQLRSTTTVTGGPLPAVVSVHLTRLALLLFFGACCGGLAGCGFLKPAKSTAHHFVLTPMPTNGPVPGASSSLAVGIGQVKLPAYLFGSSVAVRKGANEIEYLPSAFWAERLDTGFQRVLAANLAILLPTDRIILSTWQKDAVAVELYVTIEQFDVDAAGRGMLVARWRIRAPGGEKLLNAGGTRLARPGPPPDASASGAVATLSELLGDFSRQLAEALKAAPTGQEASVPK